MLQKVFDGQALYLGYCCHLHSRPLDILKVSTLVSYLFGSSGDLLEEEYVDCVQFREISFTLLSEKVVDVPLRRHFFDELVDAYLLQSLHLLLLCHLLNS